MLPPALCVIESVACSSSAACIAATLFLGDKLGDGWRCGVPTHPRGWAQASLKTEKQKKKDVAFPMRKYAVKGE